MAFPEPAGAFPAAPERSWLAICAYAAVISALLGGAVYLVRAYTVPPAKTQSAPPTIPPLIRQAQPLPADSETTYQRALVSLRHEVWQEVLPQLASVARFGEISAQRASATLVAANLLHLKINDQQQAAELYSYFLRQYPKQEGADTARYHLAFIYLSDGKLAEAEALLTAVLRDSPESPFAVSAAYVAAQTAQVMAEREGRLNRRIAAVVAQLLPSEHGPMLVLVFSVIASVGQVLVSQSQRLRRGKPITVVAILILMLLTGYTAWVNQQRQQAAIKPLVTSGLEISR